MARLGALLSGVTPIGIDEQTGMSNDAPDGRWRVYGGGAVTVYAVDEAKRAYREGKVSVLPRSVY